MGTDPETDAVVPLAFLEKSWDWTKDKAQKAVDGIKKAVSFVFDKLRSAVKTIF